MLMSSNGAGMGHLTRLLAYGTRLGAPIRPYVVSMSQAVPVVARFGMPYEYLPSAAATGMNPDVWQLLFVERLLETLDRIRPDVVVFDGTHPYRGIDDAVAAFPRTTWVWSRRGLWKPRLNRDQVAKAAWFDAVLEPGDLAAAADRGATVGQPAHRVRPVTLVDAADAADRATARAELGLPHAGPLALVSLGAGNLNDTGDQVGAVATALRKLGVGVCVTQPDIADRAVDRSDVHVVRSFPLSRWFAAFDVAVAASGYNSFHEVLRIGLPTVFVPNAGTSLDDQAARAGHAAAQGWAHHLDTVTVAAVKPLVEELLDDGASYVARARAADPGNGAADAAAFLEGLAAGGPR